MSDKVYLTGYRGTGKSAVGRRLAQCLGGDWIDLDDFIVERAGETIREIFAAGGESAFRDWETRCLELVSKQSQEKKTESSVRATQVISLGGGAILREHNRTLIASSGPCIWLDATAATLAKRIGADAGTAAARPALTDLSPEDEIAELLRVRRPLYQQAADVRIDTEGKTIEQVLQEAVTWLRSR
ncbi:shikimate kinase [Stieleria varia]|uniref:Shikimate kinase n=1 Tax=Stieleria varia TaxID=2528005 RepID=A0A5C5ZLE3_9BACT|nr:shikimate kinase [Stieleria varia]TWT87985.1 Shikimate kinase 2 [Stieleria varia]